MNLCRVLTLVLASAVFPARDASAASATVVTFEDATVGRPPPGFTTALTGPGEAGAWLVQEEPGAPSGARVLVQSSADPTGGRFPLCIYDGLTVADGRISVRFKSMAGTVDRAAGIVWRYRDRRNYYLVRANALEGNVVLYKVEDGKRSDLKPIGSGLFAYGSEAPVVAGRWQTLAVDVRGPRFSVSLDGTPLFVVEDGTFPTAGKVGLWTKADSVTAFDDLTVESSGDGG